MARATETTRRPHERIGVRAATEPPRTAARPSAEAAGDGPGQAAPRRGRGAPTAVGLLRRRPALAYVILALGLSWLVWIPGLLAAPQAQGIMYAGAFGPAVAGAVMVRAHGGRVRDWLRGMAVFRVPLRWYVLVLALPLVEPVAQAVLAAQAGAEPALTELPGRLPLVAMTFVMMLVLGGAQEEPGWRGWLLPRLQGAGMNPLVASLVIGAVWAVWHLPMFVLGPYAGLPFELYAPWVVAASVLFTWVYNATGGSVVMAMLLHAQVNAAAAWLPLSESVIERLGADEGFVTGFMLTLVAIYVVLAGLVVATKGTRLGAER